MAEPEVDVAALHRALDLKRDKKGISWRGAADEIGVSASTLTRMAQGAGPDMNGFARMVTWLGVSADDFILRGDAPKPASKDEDLIHVVSRHLRASKELDPKSAKALENIIQAAYKQMRELKSK